jgi:hypothetical protein
MYPYLLEFTRISDFTTLFYLSRLVTPGYRILDFGGNTGVLCAGTSATASKPTLDFCWNAAEVTAVSLFRSPRFL